MAYTIGFYMFYQLLELRVIRRRDSRLHFQTEKAEIYGSINKISLILSHPQIRNRPHKMTQRSKR